MFTVPALLFGTLSALAGSSWVNVLRVIFYIAGVGLVAGWIWANVLLRLVQFGWRKAWTAGFVGAAIGGVSLLLTMCISAALNGAFDRSRSDMAELSELGIPLFALILGIPAGFGLGLFAGCLLPDSVVKREASESA